MQPALILVSYGSRPEAIKLAPVIYRLKKTPQFDVVTCVSGQQRELLDQANHLFGIIPDYDLNIMREDQSLQWIVSQVTDGLSSILRDLKPDLLLVQGDTTTAMASAMTAYLSGVQIGHVEAGLRSHDKEQPFPEEINRRVISLVASIHFSPTVMAKDNLISEGIALGDIYVTGNTVIDALNYVRKLPFDVQKSQLNVIPKNKKIVTITAHRRENIGKPLNNICAAIKSLALELKSEVHFVVIVHPNPNIKDSLHRDLSGISNVSLIEPQDYRALQYLLERTDVLLSDSGGLQEEAPYYGIPILILREKTERVEGLDDIYAKLVGTEPGRIFRETISTLKRNPVRESRDKIYGDGKAAERIVEILESRISRNSR